MPSHTTLSSPMCQQKLKINYDSSFISGVLDSFLPFLCSSSSHTRWGRKWRGLTDRNLTAMDGAGTLTGYECPGLVGWDAFGDHQSTGNSAITSPSDCIAPPPSVVRFNTSLPCSSSQPTGLPPSVTFIYSSQLSVHSVPSRSSTTPPASA